MRNPAQISGRTIFFVNKEMWKRSLFLLIQNEPQVSVQIQHWRNCSSHLLQYQLVEFETHFIQAYPGTCTPKYHLLACLQVWQTLFLPTFLWTHTHTTFAFLNASVCGIEKQKLLGTHQLRWSPGQGRHFLHVFALTFTFPWRQYFRKCMKEGRFFHVTHFALSTEKEYSIHCWVTLTSQRMRDQ